MKDLLGTGTVCIDAFSEQEKVTRNAAIIGGEAVILHGVPLPPQSPLSGAAPPPLQPAIDSLRGAAFPHADLTRRVV